MPKGTSVADAIVKKSEGSFQAFLDEYALSADEVARMTRCAQKLQKVIRKTLGSEWMVEKFGSVANGFGTRGSDLDLTVVSSGSPETTDGTSPVEKLRQQLQPSLNEHPNFEIMHEIYGAKVPILKLRYEQKLDVDISCSNVRALLNTKLLGAYAMMDSSVQGLVIAIKSWAKAVGVCGAAERNLSSYSITLMVLYYLQVDKGLMMPRLPPAAFAPGGMGMKDPEVKQACQWKAPRGARALVAGFFRFFALNFSWGREVVSVRRGERSVATEPCYELLPHRWASRLHVEDPYELDRNLHCVLGVDREEQLIGWIRGAHAACEGGVPPTALARLWTSAPTPPPPQAPPELDSVADVLPPPPPPTQGPIVLDLDNSIPTPGVPTPPKEATVHSGLLGTAAPPLVGLKPFSEEPRGHALLSTTPPQTAGGPMQPRRLPPPSIASGDQSRSMLLSTNPHPRPLSDFGQMQVPGAVQSYPVHAPLRYPEMQHVDAAVLPAVAPAAPAARPTLSEQHVDAVVRRTVQSVLDADSAPPSPTDAKASFATQPLPYGLGMFEFDCRPSQKETLDSPPCEPDVALNSLGAGSDLDCLGRHTGSGVSTCGGSDREESNSADPHTDSDDLVSHEMAPAAETVQEASAGAGPRMAQPPGHSQLPENWWRDLNSVVVQKAVGAVRNPEGAHLGMPSNAEIETSLRGDSGHSSTSRPLGPHDPMLGALATGGRGTAEALEAPIHGAAAIPASAQFKTLRKSTTSIAHRMRAVLQAERKAD